MVSYVRLT